MNRRRFIAALGTAWLAGCMGTGTDGDSGNGSATPTDKPPTDSPTPTMTQAETDTPEANVSISVGTPQSVSVDLGYYSGPAWEVSVKNTGTAPSNQTWLTFDWFDGNDGYLKSSSAPCASIAPGETWVARSYPNGVDAKVERAEVSLQETPEVYSFGVDGVKLTDSTFRASSEQVLVRGAAENTRDTPLGYLLAVGKVYAEDGTLLAAEYTNETDIAAGETWRFEMQPWTVDRGDIAAAGGVLLSTGAI